MTNESTPTPSPASDLPQAAPEAGKRLVSALVLAAWKQEREPGEANQIAYRKAREAVEAALAAPAPSAAPHQGADALREDAILNAMRRFGCDTAPVAWAYHFNDPDPQIDIEFCRECPAGWVGKAEPLYEGPGIRPFEARAAVSRLAWLHSSASNDVGGYEWGIFRVKWENGKAVEVWQTASDFSDLDAARAALAQHQAPQQGEQQ